MGSRHLSHNSAAVTAIAAVAGLTLGFFARPADKRGDDIAHGKTSSGSGATSATERDKPDGNYTPRLGIPASSDTLEDLVTIKQVHELYPRLALWLPNASEADCIALHDAECKRRPVDYGLVRLVLSRWTRLNPKAAIDATKGKPGERECWALWAEQDPHAALSHATSVLPKRTTEVYEVIVATQPDLAIKLMANNPDIPPATLFYYQTRTLLKDDPEAALKLITEHDVGVLEGAAISSLTKRDPRAAFAWLQENPTLARKGAEKEFIQILASKGPGAFDEFISATPSGSFKRTLESARFRLIAGENPEHALEIARTTESPLVASERLILLGYQQVAQDPSAALEIYKELLTNYPKQTSRSHGFLKQLMAADPAGTMAKTLEAEASGAGMGNPRAPSFEHAAGEWVKDDPEAFAGWLGQQTSEQVRDRGAIVLAEDLAEAERFDEAIQWASKPNDIDPQQDIAESIIHRWLSTNEAAAPQWLASGNVPKELHERFSSLLESP